MSLTSYLPESFNIENLDALKFIGIGYVGLLWLSIIVWVTRDILSRSNSLFFQALCILLVIALPIVGVLLYLIIRPGKTLMEKYYEQLETGVLQTEQREMDKENETCGKCLTDVSDDFVFCPSCGEQLKKVCFYCKRSFDEKWDICPYCGKAQKPKAAAKIGRKTFKKPELQLDLDAASDSLEEEASKNRL